MVVGNFLQSLRRKLGGGSSDPHIKSFVRHNRRKWRPARHAPKVVLVGLFAWKPSLFCFSYIANAIASRCGASIRTFYFRPGRDIVAEELYASFGATTGIDWEMALGYDEEATALTEKIFSGLKTKWDVLAIEVEGFLLGDLIYDTLLRSYTEPTVQLDDPRLKALIHDGISIYFASRDYFARNKVVAVVPEHTTYIYGGVLVRMACRLGIPVYASSYDPYFCLIRLDPTLSEGMVNNTKRWPYYKYDQIFAGLPAGTQEAAILKARASLQERLSGAIDNKILKGITAYGAKSEERILEATDKPKILILMHDFCDSVHMFRRMLFPDFYEWIHYLLERASGTDFEWYAKPHPNSLTSKEKNAANAAVVEELKAKFPKIHFIDPGVSNRQLVDEGVAAMFTVHGTAGHEFAYMGVPVVNGGDNLQIAYDFNIHAQTIEEFNECIDNAGNLPVKIRPEKVEEFFYMHYFYFREEIGARENLVGEEFRIGPDAFARGSKTQALTELIEGATPEREREILTYLENFFDRDGALLRSN